MKQRGALLLLACCPGQPARAQTQETNHANRTTPFYNEGIFTYFMHHNADGSPTACTGHHGLRIAFTDTPVQALLVRMSPEPRDEYDRDFCSLGFQFGNDRLMVLNLDGENNVIYYTYFSNKRQLLYSTSPGGLMSHNLYLYQIHEDRVEVLDTIELNLFFHAYIVSTDRKDRNVHDATYFPHKLDYVDLDQDGFPDIEIGSNDISTIFDTYTSDIRPSQHYFLTIRNDRFEPNTNPALYKSLFQDAAEQFLQHPSSQEKLAEYLYYGVMSELLPFNLLTELDQQHINVECHVGICPVTAESISGYIAWLQDYKSGHDCCTRILDSLDFREISLAPEHAPVE